MAGYSELIKNFGKTRGYIRDFFLYGFKVRSDFTGKSARTYDNERRRAESWLGSFLRYEHSPRGVQTVISVDSGHVAENPFFRMFASRSFTDNDIRLHFLLLDLLGDGDARTLREITDTLSEAYGAVFDEQTVRGKLREYAAEGLLISEKKGKTAYFRISPDTADGWLREFRGLADAIRFFSAAGAFSEVGYSLLCAAGLRNDRFLMKHNYIVHVLEDVLLETIAEAASAHQLLEITVLRAQHRSSDAQPRTYTVYPLQTAASVQTGRRWLAAYIPAENRLCTFRLDAICEAVPAGPYDDYAEAEALYQRSLPYVFGVSFGGSTRPEPVRLTFRADPQTEGYIIERLRREKRIGRLEQTAPDRWTLTVDTADPNEVMHWAKTFIGRIVSAEGGTEEIRGRFYADIARMHRMYGGQTDERFQ